MINGFFPSMTKIRTIAGKEVFARLRADAEARPGDMLPLVFNLDKAVYFDPVTGMRLQ